MSEVPLYTNGPEMNGRCRHLMPSKEGDGKPASTAGQPARKWPFLQGYLAHKKTQPPRTSQ